MCSDTWWSAVCASICESVGYRSALASGESFMCHGPTCWLNSTYRLDSNCLFSTHRLFRNDIQWVPRYHVWGGRQLWGSCPSSIGLTVSVSWEMSWRGIQPSDTKKPQFTFGEWAFWTLMKLGSWHPWVHHELLVESWVLAKRLPFHIHVCSASIQLTTLVERGWQSKGKP